MRLSPDKVSEKVSDGETRSSCTAGPVRRPPTTGNWIVDGTVPRHLANAKGTRERRPVLSQSPMGASRGSRRSRSGDVGSTPRTGSLAPALTAPRRRRIRRIVDDLILAIARQSRLYGQRRVRDEPPRARRRHIPAAERVAAGHGDARVGLGHDHDEPGPPLRRLSFRLVCSSVVQVRVVRVRAAGSEPRALRVEAALLVLST